MSYLLRSSHCSMLACTRSSSVPTFLVPFLNESTRPSDRCFSTSAPKRSRIGGTPIAVPSGVVINILEPVITQSTNSTRRGPPPRLAQVEGPLGKLSVPIPNFLLLTHDTEGKKLHIQIPEKKEREQRAMWGTMRALLNNHILGVSEGHSAILTLNGVGYRASLESSAAHKIPTYPGQQFLSLKLGYSHPVDLPVPERVKASIPQPTRILLEGIDKQEVNQFAAEIRGWKRPEPYKGKGIFLNDETIKLKAKKIK